MCPSPSVIPHVRVWHQHANYFAPQAPIAWQIKTVAEVAPVKDIVLAALVDLTAHTSLECVEFDPETGGANQSPALVITVDPQLEISESTSPEAFTIEIEAAQIQVLTRSNVGVRWAINALIQMFDLSSSTGQPTLACGSGISWPDYPVRGFMLDVGRRFVPSTFLVALIKYLGRHNLNTLIIHVNDNEIAKDTGRAWSQAQHAFRLASDNPKFSGLIPKDGHYTRADWDSLEDTAAAFGVTLVPEIDSPAHSRSFIVEYPNLGLNNGDSDMLDLENPDTHTFMQELFSEFLPWFRGPWVHFGADEYDKNLPHVYRDYFNSMSRFLTEQGKQPWAWGSATSMAGDFPRAADYNRDVTICSWNNEWYGGKDAIEDGFSIINMNDAHLYLVPFADYYQGKQLDGPALWESWEPHIFGDNQDVPKQHPRLLGAISALWNDLVLLDYDEQVMAQMIEPTFALLAQKIWAGKTPDSSFYEFMRQVEKLPDNMRTIV